MEKHVIDIDENIAMDIEQLTNGGFSPLKTFMNFTELDNVLEKMRLPSGEVWSMPILFPKPKIEIKIGEPLILKFRGIEFARFVVEGEYSYDLEKMIKQFFGTDNIQHPGVVKLRKIGNEFVTGKLSKLVKLDKILKIKALDPDSVKKQIKLFGWKKIVGFHTRNPPHSAHEFLHKEGLKHADGILIHPIIGSKKKGDFTNTAIINCYNIYANTAFSENNCIMTPLLTYSRYAGPREAIFTALIRRNYGCTHFIVGRDHTGVKNFYEKYESQEIFKKFPDIGIEPIFFSEPYFCKICDKITTDKECKCGEKGYVEISGTIIRNAILNKTDLSEIYIRKQILDELQKLDNVFIE